MAKLKTWAVVCVACAVALLAGACGGDDEGSPESSTGNAPSASSSQSAPIGQEPAAPEGGGSTEQLPVLGTAEGTGDGRTGVRIDVNRLSRATASIVTLDATVTNNGAEEMTFLAITMEGPSYRAPSASGVTLIDPDARLRYYPLRDTDRRCVCTPFVAGDRLPPGSSVRVTVSFPAPPASVEAMTVDWTGFGPVAEVPIS